jgi:hypothetical protein
MSNWKSRQISRRLRELSLQFAGYFIVTLLLMSTAAILIIYLLPAGIQNGSIQFLALIYMCCLGIVTAHSFDENHIKFQLDLIAADLERLTTNTASMEIESIIQAVNELTLRIGKS